MTDRQGEEGVKQVKGVAAAMIRSTSTSRFPRTNTAKWPTPVVINARLRLPSPLLFFFLPLTRASLSFPFVQILNDFPYRFFSHINTHTYTYIYILEIKSSKFRLSWCLHTRISNRRSFEYLYASSIFLLNSSSSLESILSSKF